MKTGYGPSSFIFTSFNIEPGRIEVHTPENERGQYRSILNDRAWWSMKERLIIGETICDANFLDTTKLKKR